MLRNGITQVLTLFYHDCHFDADACVKMFPDYYVLYKPVNNLLAQLLLLSENVRNILEWHESWQMVN